MEDFSNQAYDILNHKSSENQAAAFLLYEPSIIRFNSLFLCIFFDLLLFSVLNHWEFNIFWCWTVYKTLKDASFRDYTINSQKFPTNESMMKPVIVGNP